MSTTADPTTFTDAAEYWRAKDEHNRDAAGVLHFFTGYIESMTGGGRRNDARSLAFLVDELERQIGEWRAAEPEWLR